jgi:hypothetical protein
MGLFRFTLALILSVIAGTTAGLLALFHLFGAYAPGGWWGLMYGVSDVEGALSVVIAAVAMIATMTGLATWLDHYEARKWATWREGANK